MSFREELKKRNKFFCTGCSSCVNTCKFDALKLEEDEYGYLRSSLSADKCIDCHACDSVCPILYGNLRENKKEPSIYAVQMSDGIRKMSSSGGVFYQLASEIIRNGGAVAGCVYSDTTKAEHIITDNIDDVKRMCGSKYIQSNLGKIFVQIKEVLDRGQEVLFSGTPCQVSGLYSFLGVEYKNLVTVDVLCYYVPSRKMLQDYIEEHYPNEQISHIAFRDKNNGWSSEKMTITALDEQGNERKYICKREDDLFQKAFHSRLLMPDQCSECMFSSIPRQGDITLGDFWQVSQYIPDMDDGKGTSAVLINSDKGTEYFEKIRSNCKADKAIKLKYLKGNRLDKSALRERTVENRRFFHMYKNGDFCCSAREALDNHYDVAIIGCWDVKNYGSNLTYYALCNVIKKFGYTVLLVGCPKNARYISSGNAELFNESPYDEWEISKQYRTTDEMIDLNERADTFLVGSDQVWNRNLFDYFGRFTLLDYVLSTKRKIAYAASFGKANWDGSEQDKTLFNKLLARFDAISVRESTGIKICKDEFGIEASWCIDPIFLCGIMLFDALGNKSKITLPRKFLAAYILDYSEEKEGYIRKFADKLQMELVVVTDPNINPQGWKLDAHRDFSLEDWIKLFKDSSYVITDSFHGTCMALIYKKKFISLVNEKRGATRFYDYAERFAIKDRTIENIGDHIEIDSLIEGPDYSIIEPLIDKAKSESYKWLESNLKVEIKSKELSDFDKNRIMEAEHNRARNNKVEIRVIKRKIKNIIKKAIKIFR